MSYWLVIVGAVIIWALGFYGMIDDMARFRAGLKIRNFLTLGDMMMCLCMSLIPPVGLVLLVKNLVGIKIDWDAPFFRGPKP